MPPLAFQLRSVAISSLICACASTSSTGSAASSCDDLQEAARTEVSIAIQSNLACTKDADCVSIAFSVNRCFDSCSRTVAASGVAAVDSAKAKVDGAQCEQFRAKGCTAEIPPCAPDATPRCNAGVCT